MEKEKEMEMEVEMLEDDVFFAELSKRISLLITDEDEDEADFGPAQPPAAVPVVPAFSLAHVPQGASMLAPPAYTLYHHAASYGGRNSSSGNGGDGARTWQQQCGSKGTGVFIPQSSPGSVHPRNKGKNKGGSNAATHKARAQVGSTLAAGAPTERRV